MQNKNTLVSVILPVRNAGRYLSDCLESLRSQSYNNIEIIAIDDCSRDDSVNILNKFKRLDKRIKVFQNKKQYGLAVCFNRAMKQAKGRFVTFMSPHDMSTRFRFARQVSFLEQNPKVVGVGSQSVLIDEENKQLGKSTFPQGHEGIYHKLLTGLSMQFESVVLNKMLLPKDILKFTTNSYPFIFSGVFVKLQQYGKYANLDQYLYYHRQQTLQIYQHLSGMSKTFSFIKLWLNSITEHDYRPSFQSLLQPFITPLKTIFQ